MSDLRSVDYVIEAGWVLPVNAGNDVLKDHALVIDADKIVAILPISEVASLYQATQTISRPNHALLPGLVNAHTHNPMTLMRGYADDLPLMEWLTQHIWPAEAKFMGPEFVRDGVELAVAEMLRRGTTCCNENYFFPDVQAATYQRLGFRAMVGLPIIEFPSAWAASPDQYFDKALAVYDDFKNSALLSMSFAPHAPYTVSNQSFERIRVLADQLNLPVHLHLHETAQEIEDSKRDHGMRPFARIKSLGLVNQSLIAVHMTQLLPEEIAQSAQAGVSVVHCPESNLKLASGFCPAHALQQAGINLALGTDGCASNNDLDMFGEMRSAALLAKAVAQDATAINATQALRMATINGAKALGLDDKIGSLEVGKQADVIAVDLSALESQPMYQAVSQLVYATGRHQVTDVWIAGKAKLRDRELVDLDQQELRSKAQRWAQRLQAVS